MTVQSLIEKLEELTDRTAKSGSHVDSYNSGINTAIAIVRQHHAAQGDAVEAVARAIAGDVFRIAAIPVEGIQLADQYPYPIYQCAIVAVAAMQEFMGEEQPVPTGRGATHIRANTTRPSPRVNKCTACSDAAGYCDVHAPAVSGQSSDAGYGNVALSSIADQLQSWIDWSTRERAKEPELRTDETTHIMSLPVPYWPTHGMLKAWVEAIRKTAGAVAPTRSSTPSAHIAMVGRVLERYTAKLLETNNLFTAMESAIALLREHDAPPLSEITGAAA